MKLSELVNLKERIDELDCSWEAEQLNQEMLDIIDSAQHSITHLQVNDLKNQHQQVLQTVNEFAQKLQNLKKFLANTIESRDQQYFEIETAYWEAFKNDLSYTIQNRSFSTDTISNVLLKERLTAKTNWQYPALIFRPIHALHIEDLVACDPMYWIDTDQDLIDAASGMFNPEYQRRICKYVLPDQEKVDLSILPSQQFGLVYACRYFNFRPTHVIKNYLEQIFNLLRPGGHLVFSFNNCDTTSGSLTFEHHGGCYTPGRIIKNIALSIGYTVEYEYSDTMSLSWVELKKPGTITSIRAGQTLAAIKKRTYVPDTNEIEEIYQPTTLAERIDFSNKDIYNEQTLLIEIANMLGLDLNMSLSKGQPHPKKLRKMISAYFRSDDFPVEKINRLLAKRKAQ